MGPTGGPAPPVAGGVGSLQGPWHCFMVVYLSIFSPPAVTRNGWVRSVCVCVMAAKDEVACSRSSGALWLQRDWPILVRQLLVKHCMKV
jgi:hypothetical protein